MLEKMRFKKFYHLLKTLASQRMRAKKQTFSKKKSIQDSQPLIVNESVRIEENFEEDDYRKVAQTILKDKN